MDINELKKLLADAGIDAEIIELEKTGCLKHHVENFQSNLKEVNIARNDLRKKLASLMSDSLNGKPIFYVIASVQVLFEMTKKMLVYSVEHIQTNEEKKACAEAIEGEIKDLQKIIAGCSTVAETDFLRNQKAGGNA